MQFSHLEILYMDRPLKIAIAAAENSGDRLAAGLVQKLNNHCDDIRVYGIAGPQLIEAGCEPWYSIDQLSVMGFGEVIKSAVPILRMRRAFIKRLLADPPDIFIGVDAYDFNITIERKLKQQGIPVIHYVSPKLWAWRQNRIFKMKQAVDLVLCLFEFETKCYAEQNIKAKFIGHPLADHIPLQDDQAKAREQLGLDKQATIISLLPGSRAMEIKQMGKIFLDAANLCLAKNENLQFISPMINPSRRQQFIALKQQFAPQLPLILFDGHADYVISAADTVLCSAGTATLQTMLHHRQQVVAYHMSAATNWYFNHYYRYPYVALPNIISGKSMVPEFVQEKVTAKNLSTALLLQLANDQLNTDNHRECYQLHSRMRKNADEMAAQSVLALLKQKEMQS